MNIPTDLDPEELNPLVMAKQIKALTLLVESIQSKQFEKHNELIKIDKFCEVTGETKDSLKKLRDNNLLAEGQHWIKRPGSNVIYFNIKEYNKWLIKRTKI